MNKSFPLVDIVMATYNGEKYISEQIESIQSQTYSNWRLLISDDCSGDRTLEIIRNYAEKDERIIILPQKKNGGAKENFFYATKYSDFSEYVMFCDQDDVWDSDKVSFTLGKMLSAELEYGSDLPILVCTDMRVVDENLNELHESCFELFRANIDRLDFRVFLGTSFLAGCAMMSNRKLIDLFNRTQNLDGVFLHDWWIALIASAFGKIFVVKKATNSYRQHESNVMGANSSAENLFTATPAAWSQAVAFEREFGDIVPDKQKKPLKEYAALARGEGFQLAHRVKSGVWIPGIRGKIGSLYRTFSPFIKHVKEEQK
ncbi:MAG: glycosyltransferase family 2 protein [Anaerotardibacter sp.]